MITNPPTRSSCRACADAGFSSYSIRLGRRVPMAGAARARAMGKMQKAVAVAAVDDLWWNRHGFPQGYHFVPDDPELLRLLEDKIAGRALPHPLPTIFHDVRLRDYHPAELYEEYRAWQEAGSIYLFSEREFRGNARVRPGRLAQDGWWKASGGGEPLKRRGLTVGSKLTLVFYDKKPGDKLGVKTNWAIKEYTKIVDKKAEEMALYRLYKMSRPSNGKQAAQEDEDAPAFKEETPPPAGQPHDYHYGAFGAAPGPSTSYSVTGPGPSTSYSVTPDGSYMGPQHNIVQYTNRHAPWDVLPAMIRSPVPSGPAAATHCLPASAEHFGYQETAADAKHPGYQETTDPLKAQQLLPASAEQFDYQETPHFGCQETPVNADHFGCQETPVDADHFGCQETPIDAKHFGCQETTCTLKTELPSPPAALAAQGGYLADEFDDWCQAQQGLQQVPMSPSFPMPDDIDSQQVAASPFPVLEDTDFDGFLEDIDIDSLLEDMQTIPTEENSERFSCTLDELLYPKMEDDTSLMPNDVKDVSKEKG
ncbi:hypothetical protein VPH35_124349 [Triticum aestivum]